MNECRVCEGGQYPCGLPPLAVVFSEGLPSELLVPAAGIDVPFHVGLFWVLV